MSRKKTHEEYIKELTEKNPYVEAVESYNGANIAILHRCKIHETVWRAYPTNILRGHGCPLCGNNFKKTHEQYCQEVAEINPLVEVVGDYINAYTKIKHRCKVDDYVWDTYPYVILRGDGCPKCAGNAKKHTDGYIAEVSSINPNIEVIDSYVNANTPILHKCKIDGHTWAATPANILLGRGCPLCKFRTLSQTFVKSHDQYVEDVLVINPDIEVIETYINAHTPILHRCKMDGYIWKATPSNILTGQGCPECQVSNGERQVKQWLQAHNVMYIYQHLFDGCKDKKVLPFDFYIPQHNMCIEFDGRQHFEPVDFAGRGVEWAIEQFEQTNLHDEIKNQYCKDNNIHLLRIPYYKNVEEELETFLFI